MYIFLSILIVLASLLLVGAVLIQKSKGGGLASNYASGNQYMGYRKTTDFIEKVTWGLAIFICVLSICTSFAVKTPINSSSIKQAPAQTTAPAPAPAQPAAPRNKDDPSADCAAAPFPEPSPQSPTTNTPRIALRCGDLPFTAYLSQSRIGVQA